MDTSSILFDQSIHFLAENPLLLLFLVAAIGYPLGRIQVRGFSLGIAAVLFTGLAIGSLSPELKLPEFCHLFGLTLFVYTIGLSGGPGFFTSLRNSGIRENILAAGVIIIGGIIAFAASVVFGFSPSLSAGLFAGSMTNTPALANVLEYIKTSLPKEVSAAIMSEPVVAYSITYPIGVIGIILAMYVFQKLWKIDYKAEAQAQGDHSATSDKLVDMTVKVTNSQFFGKNILALAEEFRWKVRFMRLLRNNTMFLVSNTTILEEGDLVSVIGVREQVTTVSENLGSIVQLHLEDDRSYWDFRRMFVSNPEAVGRPLHKLHVRERFEARISRIRRGDTDFVATPNTSLMPGDRVRVVAPRDRMEEVAQFFGDSYKSLSEVDILTLSVGIALGLLLGSLPIPLPNGETFRLGFAGGPLIVGLILGSLGRVGRTVWYIPYSANLTLRQIGLILFLAGVGTRSGYAFGSVLGDGNTLPLFAAGAFLTATVAFLTLVIGYKLLKIPMGRLIGVLAGLQTQPAALAFANEQTGTEAANLGYTTVFPLATILKIIVAQVLLMLLL